MLRPTVPAMLVLLAAAPALADKPFTSHFGGINSCYERVYSDEHLARHPAQKVTHIRLTHFPRFSGPFGADGRPLIYPDAPEIVVGLAVVLRGIAEPQFATGFCRPEGVGMACGLECDGGRFTLIDRGDGQILLRLRNPIFFHDCGEGEVTLDPEPDDRAFLLSRLPDSACTPPG